MEFFVDFFISAKVCVYPVGSWGEKRESAASSRVTPYKYRIPSKAGRTTRGHDGTLGKLEGSAWNEWAQKVWRQTVSPQTWMRPSNKIGSESGEHNEKVQRA